MSGRALDWRALGALVLLLVGVLIGLAIDEDNAAVVTVTATSPAPGVAAPPGSAAPAPAQPPAAPPPPRPQTFRQPRAGEGVFEVQGTVSHIRFPAGAGTPATGQYTTLVIHAETGPPLRAGAAGDLRQNPNVRQSLVDPACAGRVVGRFTVARAPYTGLFDYSVLRLRAVRDACRP